MKRVGKSDKMRGLSSILSLFRNGFDKFNSKGTRMLDSIYHITLKLLLKIAFFAWKRPDFAIFLRSVKMAS